MNKLIKSILILTKSIFDDEKEKNGNRNINLANIFTHTVYIEKENLSLRVLFDWAARPYDDDRDLYRYKLIVVPEDWDPNKYISLMYDIKKELFYYQCIYKDSGKSCEYDKEDMLKHIHNVLENIKKERGI